MKWKRSEPLCKQPEYEHNYYYCCVEFCILHSILYALQFSTKLEYVVIMYSTRIVTINFTPVYLIPYFVLMWILMRTWMWHCTIVTIWMRCKYILSIEFPSDTIQRFGNINAQNIVANIQHSMPTFAVRSSSSLIRVQKSPCINTYMIYSNWK